MMAALAEYLTSNSPFPPPALIEANRDLDAALNQYIARCVSLGVPLDVIGEAINDAITTAEWPDESIGMEGGATM